jgi:ABC-type multidrug transport system fused ATPase/permease subunit
MPRHDSPGGDLASTAEPLPLGLLRFTWTSSGRHQLALAGLAVMVFALSTAPLELQRRMVNDIVKGGGFRPVLFLAGIYAAMSLAEGGIKLILNIYSAWVSENAVRQMRRRIATLIGDETAPTAGPMTGKAAEVIDDPGGDSSDRGRRQGVETSLILSEVEPVGAFIGTSFSQPLMQGGLLISVFGYLAFLDYRMALLNLLVFAPQLIFVPLLQRMINRRSRKRITVLRDVSGGVITASAPGTEDADQNGRIDHVFTLNMSVYKLKFTMNFLMNLMYHLGVVGALVIGGWFVITGRTELGTVVAFLSGLAKVNDPWGDIVDWFRDMTITIVKYHLIRDAIARLTTGRRQPSPVAA